MGNFITMPKLGMTMTEGKIIKWLVDEGATVEKGDYIFEVETDKTSLEVDVLYSGKILKIYYGAGETAPVNEPVAFIGEEGEEIPEVDKSAAAAAAAPAETPAAPAAAAPAAPAKKEVMKEKAQRPEGNFDYDLIVVGAGPGGYVAAIRAAQLGAKVAIVEKDTVGGTCLNRGCIPTKAYYASAKHWKDIQNAEEFGISVSGSSFDWKKILDRKNKIVKQLTNGVGGLLAKNKVELIQGEAVIEKANEVKVGGKTYTCAFTLLATGAKPASVIKTDARLLNTDQILDIDKLPESIVIIGGGVIGCEMACIFNAFGVKTTVVELMDQILPMTDDEVAATLSEHMKKSGINLLTGTTCDEIKEENGKYTIKLSNGQTMECEMMLEAVGRSAEGSGFEKLDVKRTPKGCVEVDELMRTSVPYIYAIGDINGKFQLAHAASEQGILAVEHMFGGIESADEQAIPSCIFTDLEIAFVGLSEKQAKEQGIPVKTYKFPYAANGKALTLGETEGFVKVIADERWGEILGVHIIGAEASSMIEEAVMAMRCEATAEAAGSTIHAHPTLSETLMEAFLGASRGAIHM
ncbi:dihydrolipoyl dehydrogenase [Christensenellaceae bacterium]|nr:dihydrolipoyl dehydrogenase [Christensenellaceae bacterium]BDF60437.1 dihydrolipoyl dehydrogenase [Christensenellaceae bacterium]